MRKLSIFLLIGVLAVLAWPSEAQACDPPCDPLTVNLMAAQHYDVGGVTVSNDSTYLTVEYAITEPGFCITETHLYVDPNDPTKSAPGQFPWGDDDLPCVTGWQQDIALSDFGAATSLWVAAHAVVCGAGADYYEFEAGLAAEMASAGGRVSATFVDQGGLSYWQVMFNDGEELAGNTYPGWCVDTERTIGGTHQMLLIPTYIDDGFGGAVLNPEAMGWVDKPENLDLVNWIINQNYVGQPSTCDGNYTQGDVQRAIWELIDDSQTTNGLTPWSPCRAAEIAAAAVANGEGFVPMCGQVVAVLLVDDSGTYQMTIFQVTFFELGLPCVPTGDCETAWGAGVEIRPGKNWAMTFPYAICQ